MAPDWAAPWPLCIPICRGCKISARGVEGLATPGARLRQAIELRGMTQVVAAHAIGLDQGNLSKVLRDQIALSTAVAERAAGALGVRAGWLLFGEGDTTDNVEVAREEGRREALRAVAAFVEAQLQEADAPTSRREEAEEALLAARMVAAAEAHRDAQRKPRRRA